ncbi:methyltransferase domain-containing protein [Actinocatenispora rupis]|uniref:Protein-L-isoaspartate O-methyltransferase n=1 Tax=Actinocatenispora rupis TaxID=519421 RepID=A0A8J3JAN9_9ACTN|nr:methyltransferase domain-containing protein [Actinocatenispora rupis]GID14927.1 protein-L-isoaspartate O-methyltransferase [Actinocatenispora rupis]
MTTTDANHMPVEQRASQLRRRMVDALLASGDLVSPEWQAAFTVVPRHVFVPEFWQQGPGGQQHVGAHTADAWLTGVYDDRVLMIRPDGGSSSTVPSLMAVMLEALDVTDGQRVLEIGTGSGYNAALLCHRLGGQNVTTVDINPELVTDVRVRLSEAGYRPTVAVGDGAAGWADGAPYDRLIATCAVDTIPPAWLEQVRSGGRIIVPIATGIAALTVTRPGGADGPFLAISAYFMPLRGADEPAAVDTILAVAADPTLPARATTLGADVWFDNAFRFLLAATLPGLRLLTSDPAQQTAIVTHPDGSWARLADGKVTQGGPRDIWAIVERTRRQWDRLGHPNRERFTLTATGNHQHIRLANTALAWRLPTTAP